jgi:ATP-dependent DNA ligase
MPYLAGTHVPPDSPLPVGLPAAVPSDQSRAAGPSGDIWLHEIKLDGFRLVARKNGAAVRLYSRPGNELTQRFPSIADAIAGLRVRSCIIDGEAVATGCDTDAGTAVSSCSRSIWSS